MADKNPIYWLSSSYTPLLCMVKENPLFVKLTKKTQRIDSLIKFNTDENKLQYLAV
jgi:hypothetical protein